MSCKAHDLFLLCGVYVYVAVFAARRRLLPVPIARASTIAPMPIEKPIAASPQANPADVDTSSVRTSAWLVAGVGRSDRRATSQYWWQVVTGVAL